ncbi:MAG: kynureninase [Ignavibacteria bacterium]|nr:kynureninase [Ignavibacteria bacterium]MBL0322917.1 kynureninase [Ignavibacteria bacterium]
MSMNVTIETIDSWKKEAERLDSMDDLAHFRSRFLFPQHQGRNVRYFCGNSLGLQPAKARQYVNEELDDWQDLGVEGHFKSRRPWFSYHRWFAEPLAQLVGAKVHEVVAANTLTANLHLMMTSFYRPTETRNRIIMAGHEFPSDRYAVESQVRLHGFTPEEAMVEVQPAPGMDTLTTEQIIGAINEHGSSTALVLFSGVHFFTGQRFEMKEIAAAAHSVGAMVGFDLAHAVGNVELSLHDWDADFAVWCSYKYLNAGPGAVGGLFVHERFANQPDLPRLAGWWGNDEATRFTMEHQFVPTFGADGWQLSNAQVLQMAALRASLETFVEAGFDRISAKRDRLTAFAERVINDVIGARDWIRIITPSTPQNRGAQLSIHFDRSGREVFDALIAAGVIVDWRTPSVIRLAPAPLYSSFADVAAFGEAFAQILEGKQ